MMLSLLLLSVQKTSVPTEYWSHLNCFSPSFALFFSFFSLFSFFFSFFSFFFSVFLIVFVQYWRHLNSFSPSFALLLSSFSPSFALSSHLPIWKRPARQVRCLEFQGCRRRSRFFKCALLLPSASTQRNAWYKKDLSFLILILFNFSTLISFNFFVK